jgi:hypothetical protein
MDTSRLLVCQRHVSILLRHVNSIMYEKLIRAVPVRLLEETREVAEMLIKKSLFRQLLAASDIKEKLARLNQGLSSASEAFNVSFVRTQSPYLTIEILIDP